MTPFNIHGDHDDLSETEFLKNAIATHNKYGSTNCNFGQQNYRFITHYIEPTDTLQGLALKYGCKIENIKKFNKLYSDDNNHLRSRFSILVPIETETKIQFDSDLSSSQSSSSSLDPCKRISNDQFKSHPQSLKSPKFECRNSYSFDSVQIMTTNRDNKANKDLKLTNKSISFSDTNHMNNGAESVADFLIRIDSSIAQTKNQMENLSKRVASDISIENELNRINTRKFNSPSRISTSFRSSSTSNSNSNIFDQHQDNIPNVTVNNSRNNKKIKSSLKRLEKSQEEIFEL